MNKKLTSDELLNRKNKFISLMDKNFNNWDNAIIIGNVNQLYFTGTIQDAILIINKKGDLNYFVRKSFERASFESSIDCIRQINTYKDIGNYIDMDLGNVYIESNIMTLSVLERIKKAFNIKSINALDKILSIQRAIKSEYEICWIKQSGKAHEKLLNDIVPSLLKDGISEAEFAGVLFSEMVKLGYQGLSRFSGIQTEMSVGQISFGSNSTFPTAFDGPGGSKGYSASCPFLGNSNSKLKIEDLVFVDIAFGVNGYHTDKTQIYSFKKTPEKEIQNAHNYCMQVIESIKTKLVPGAIPSEIYEEILSQVPKKYKNSFMGYKNHLVKFLGHGVGLYVDEYPAIAKGFDMPIEENMVIAIEPKISIENVGMVGCEETYLINKLDSTCLTGGPNEIIFVQ